MLPVDTIRRGGADQPGEELTLENPGRSCAGLLYIVEGLRGDETCFPCGLRGGRKRRGRIQRNRFHPNRN